MNEQPGLTLMHTVLLRYHNFLAKRLKRARRLAWGELVFQQARALVGAVMQNILFSEWLPLVLGPGVRAQYGLDFDPESRTRHEPWRDPRIFNSFATAAFRWVGNLSFSTSFLLHCSGGLGILASLPSAAFRWVGNLSFTSFCTVQVGGES